MSDLSSGLGRIGALYMTVVLWNLKQCKPQDCDIMPWAQRRLHTEDCDVIQQQ